MKPKGCFCAKIETGVLIIAWLGILNCILTILRLAFVWNDFSSIVDQNLTVEVAGFKIALNEKNVINFMSAALASTILDALVNLMMLHGTTQKRPLFLLPWLIKNGICLMVLFTIYFLLLIWFAVVEQNIGIPIFIGALGAAFFALFIYLYLVVLTHFRALMVEKNRKENLTEKSYGKDEPGHYLKFT